MIRPAERRDVPRIWTLINELADYEKLSHAVTGAFATLEKHIFDEELCQVFVCEIEGQIVGYTLSFATYSTFRTCAGMWLEDLYVTPSERGKGYGKALLHHLVETCREQERGRLEWSVLDWNEPSIQFYRAMGAEVMPDWRICRISF